MGWRNRPQHFRTPASLRPDAVMPAPFQGKRHSRTRRLSSSHLLATTDPERAAHATTAGLQRPPAACGGRKKPGSLVFLGFPGLLRNCSWWPKGNRTTGQHQAIKRTSALTARPIPPNIPPWLQCDPMPPSCAYVSAPHNFCPRVAFRVHSARSP
jgi:hypothetical protein